jgi:hypothetical protein
MKKIFTAICFVLVTASAAFAGGNVEHPGKKALGKSISLSIESQRSSQLKKDDCTVTVNGSVGVGSTSISVSCTATAGTCDAATNQVIGCISGAIKKIRAMM